jgi:hypothetical protein
MAAVITHIGYAEGVESPAGHAFEVTVHDTNQLPFSTRGIYVGVSGDLKVETTGGETVTFVGLAAGIIHPIRVVQVYNTGTSATDIIGVY